MDIIVRISSNSSSSSSSVIVRPLSRITTMGEGVHTAQGVWRSCSWNAVTVSALTQASGREFHSGTVLTKKNKCLYWAVCNRICLNLKMWWCLVLGSAGSKTVWTCTGMLHLTTLKSMASQISRLRSFRRAQFRSLEMRIHWWNDCDPGWRIWQLGVGCLQGCWCP